VTIEDLIQIHEERIAHLNHFLRRAHLDQRGKESAVARKVRRRLIGEIGQMLDYEEDALEADLEYRASTTPAQRDLDERAEPGCWDTWDQFSTDFDDLPLLDVAPILGDDGRAFDPSVGRWYHVEDSYPKKVVIAVAELGDLAALIDQMAKDLDISFTLERYFWTETTLGQWVLAEEMRQARAGGHTG